MTDVVTPYMLVPIFNAILEKYPNKLLVPLFNWASAYENCLDELFASLGSLHCP